MVLYASLEQGLRNKMLKINKLTDYATLILSHLANNPIEVVSATDIAKNIQLSIPTISKILKILCGAELVKSFRGAGGGYQLAKPANQINLTDIIFALEGDISLTECCKGTNACKLNAECTIKENWKKINDIVKTALAGLTLSDMSKPLETLPLNLRGIPVKTIESSHG